MRRVHPMLVGAVCLLGLEGSADARFMEHWDLASLWHRADHIVLAEAVPAPAADRATLPATSTYRIVKRYKGSFTRGRVVSVFDSVYRKRLADRWLAEAKGGKATRVPGPAAERFVLFLGPRARSFRHRSPARVLVPSGMRLVVGGRVYRMEQWSNPGGYRPVPQGPDPADVAGEARLPKPGTARTPITLTAFEGELLQGAARANAFARVEQIPNPALRVRLLLNLLPPPRRFPQPERYGAGGFYADDLSRRIQAAIVDAGSLEDVVEAYGRDVRGLFRTFRAPRLLLEKRRQRTRALIAMARDPKRPLHQRHAALRLVGELGSTGKTAVKKALLDLLTDRRAAIRVAAAELLGRRSETGASLTRTRSRLLRAAASVGDARSRVALLRACDRKKRLAECARLMKVRAVVSATPGPRSGTTRLSVDLGHAVAWLGRRPGLALTLRLHDQRGRAIDSVKSEGLRYTNGNNWGRGLTRFHFARPLPRGSYSAELRWKRSRGSTLRAHTVIRVP